MADIKLHVPDENSRGTEITVPEVVSEYLAWLKVRVDIGDYDPDGYRNALRWLTQFSASHQIPVGQCRQKDLSKWLAANPQWAAVSTRQSVVSKVISCFNWAADEEGGDLIAASPYRRPKSLKGLPYEPRRPAEHGEYVALMRFGSKPLRRALFFLRRTGARTKEMRLLEWPDVVLDSIDPHVLIRKHKTKRKVGGIRKIGLDLSTANWFRCLKVNTGGKGLVFRNNYNTAWDRSTFARHLRRCAVRIGLDDGVVDRVSAYCLRHTYAVDGIEAGVGSRQLADQLGQSRTDMIDLVYGKHTRDREKHLAHVNSEVLRKRRRDTK